MNLKISSVFSVKKKEKLVILGSGWAGFRVLNDIDRSLYDVCVISPRNHFVFTPLLASTTTGVLNFRSIIEPIRTDRGKTHDYYQAYCTGIDFQEKKVHCSGVHEDQFEVAYDKLIISIGSDNNTFNIPGVNPKNVYFLKELADARAIRNRIIEVFEEASIPGLSSREKKKLLHFVVVGGGPTGVEFAAELSDFFWEDLNHYFPNIPIHDVRITILEASKTILSSFNQGLIDNAIGSIKRQGIDLRTESLVKEVQPGRVILDDDSFIDCSLIVWSTGVGPRRLIKDLKDIQLTQNGRILVDKQLKVKDVESVYALGDCASIEDYPLSATAQVAQQQAKYLGSVLNSPEKKKGREFVFHPLGLMAYVGGKRSLLEMKNVGLSGFIGFLAWRSVYLTKLGGIKNKLQVPFDWTRTLIWGRDVTNF